VTLQYLDQQEADQIAYYQNYRRYVLIGICLYWSVLTLIECRSRAQADEVSEVQRLQLEIVKLVTERRVEVDVLHRRVQGGEMARTFVNRLNSRWKPLERLVAKYNVEVAKPVFEGRLSPLSLRTLKDDGIDDNDGEIWDIERLMCSSDWAVHKFVREGIEAKHRIKRAQEEQAALLLHIHRVCRWAIRQTEVLLRILEQRPADAPRIGCTRKWLELLLFSRFQTVQSMLDRANSFSLDIREHEQLLAVERRILAVLAAVGPVDAVEDEGGEEGGGEDRDEGEDEEENDIAEEEMGEVVMRVLVEELRDEAADEVNVELQRNGGVE
jgi:hypothetical protein